MTWPLPDNRLTIRIRGALVGLFIRKCGRNFTLAKGVTLNGPQGLEIGDNVYLAKGVWLNAKAGLYIEDNVLFGPNVVISTAQHVFNDGRFNSGHNLFAPVTIGKNSWIAANATVKCGVIVGENNLIASNSSVTSNTPDNAIMAGAPAVKVKDNAEGEGDKYRGVMPNPKNRQ